MPSAAAFGAGSHWRHSEQRSPARQPPIGRFITPIAAHSMPAEDYRKELEREWAEGLDGPRGNPYDNAKAESS